MHEYDTYEATLLWEGNRHRLVVDEAETTPLAGMELLADHRLTLDAVSGGRVTIEALPNSGETTALDPA
jgi:hypothetical protein